jgi:K+-sensing histidine kinase KdpD
LGRVVLQKVSEQIAECLRLAAEAEARAEATNDVKSKAEYQRIARNWRVLARSYEFQGSLGRFISFNKDRQRTLSSILANNRQTLPPAERQSNQTLPSAEQQSNLTLPPVERQRKMDLLDWLARVGERIRSYSAAAFGIALASIALATLLLFIARAFASHISHFAIFLPAILATGLLAGVPAALGVVFASILIIAWVFTPPYFAFKWPSEVQQIDIFFNTMTYLSTVYLAYLCKGVLQRRSKAKEGLSSMQSSRKSGIV